MPLDPGGIQFVTQPHVHGEVPANLNVVLNEELVLAMHRVINNSTVVYKARRPANQIISHSISGEQATESEIARRHELSVVSMANSHDHGTALEMMPACDPGDLLVELAVIIGL